MGTNYYTIIICMRCTGVGTFFTRCSEFKHEASIEYVLWFKVMMSIDYSAGSSGEVIREK